jgi:hypothetical protein
VPEPKPRTPSLFGLAPCGVCPARGITAPAVRSYRTFSPLPRRRCESLSPTSCDPERQFHAILHLWLPKEQASYTLRGRDAHVWHALSCRQSAQRLTTAAGRYLFCGTFRRVGLNPPSRTLSGTLLCGVRTFLPHHLTRQERPSGPAANLFIIFDGRNNSGTLRQRPPHLRQRN